MFLGVSGEVVMWNKAPTPGVDEKAKHLRELMDLETENKIYK